ncbi:MAG: recombinase family protein [Minisyncoccia bacterium]
MEDKPQKEIKFIAVYARVSTSNQEDQKTIDAQLSEVREFAEKNKYIIVKTYKDEGWSGDILARPELDQLRHDARSKMWDAVLVYDPDRLGRQLLFQQIVIDELKKLEIEILFVTMPPVKNASDKLLFGVRGLFAEYEKAKITERFRIGKVNRVKNGYVLTSEAPYGYTYVLNKGKRGSADYIVGHYEINEREAKIIKQIFSWVGDEGMTLRGVVRRLQGLGIQPRKSKRGVWNTSTLSTLLKHEVFIGTAYWGVSYAVIPDRQSTTTRYKNTEKTSRRIRPKKEWYPISVSAIIEKDLFERTTLRLQKNFQTLGRNTVNEYLLAGRIWCVCGGRRAGEGVQKGKHLYYRCTNRVHTFPLPPTCAEGSINARIADDIVWQRVKETLSSPKLLREQIERWRKDENRSIKQGVTIEINSTKREIAKLQTQEDRFASAYSKEIITLEKFEEYATPIRTKIRELENQIYLAGLEETPKNDVPLPNEDEVEAFAEESLKKLQNLNFPTKQAIIRQSIDKVLVTTNELQVYGLINLNIIHVVFRSEHRYCRSAERREVDAF